MMNTVMNWMVLSCKKATLLIEKSHERPLPLMSKIQLRIHTSICDRCKLYKTQSALIEDLLKSDKHSHAGIQMRDESKALVNRQITDFLKKP